MGCKVCAVNLVQRKMSAFSLCRRD